MAMTTFYLCDRRACEVCTPDCTHTSDIRHANNFRIVADSFFELNPPDLTTDTRDPQIAFTKKETPPGFTPSTRIDYAAETGGGTK